MHINAYKVTYINPHIVYLLITVYKNVTTSKFLTPHFSELLYVETKQKLWVSSLTRTKLVFILVIHANL